MAGTYLCRVLRESDRPLCNPGRPCCSCSFSNAPRPAYVANRADPNLERSNSRFSGPPIALLAVDGSWEAIAFARREVASFPNLRVMQARLPMAVAPGSLDAVVASEVLYYLPARTLSISDVPRQARRIS